MVDVICDTSFLIHLATRKVTNLDSLDVEIGQLTFTVPNVVRNELSELEKIPSKKQDAAMTLAFIRNLKTVEINGSFADREIFDYILRNRSIVATMDRKLKARIKSAGSSVLSFSNDRIVLES